MDTTLNITKLKIIDTTPELELFAKQTNPFGFKVLVKFANPQLAEQLYRNISEVHWKYKSVYPSGMGLALESNLHNTGYTHDVIEILQVNIEVEKELSAEI